MEWYKDVFRKSPVPQVLTDSGGTIIEANDEFCRRVQKERVRLKGEQLSSYLSPESFKIANSAITELKSEDGSSCPVKSETDTIYNSEGLQCTLTSIFDLDRANGSRKDKNINQLKQYLIPT